MRLFLDANILFSAAHRESGSMRLFFVLADAGWCELLASPYAIEEARRNIVRRYAGRAADLEALTAKSRSCGEHGLRVLPPVATFEMIIGASR